MLNRRNVLALLGAVPAAVMAQPVRAADPERIRVATVAADTYAEPFYFADAGIAKTFGIELETTRFTNGAGVAQACAAGAADVGVTDALLVASAVSSGVPLTVFAGGGYFTPETASSYLCVAASSPYKTAKDFEGQVIGVPTLASSVLLVAVKAWLATNGANLDRIRFVEVPFPAMSAALERQTVAGAAITEPFVSKVGPDIIRLASPYEALGKRFLVSEWITTRGWIAANAPLAKRLVAAIYETARWANANHAATAALLAANAKLDVAGVQSMKRTIYATDLNVPMVDAVLSAAAKYNVIREAVPASAIVTKV